MKITFCRKIIFFKICIFLSFNMAFNVDCPPPEELYPCKCSMLFNGRQNIICIGVEDVDDLQKIVHSLQSTRKISYFRIEKGHFMYIPHDIFKNLDIEYLYIEATSLMALTDTDIAFEGLEKGLSLLSITECEMLTEWDWHVLRKLKKMTFLDIGVNMETISQNIKDIYSPNLESIILQSNKISNIHEEAFKTFTTIEKIALDNNLISIIKRSMMPRPADSLKSLSLSHNKIKKIPPDMFEDMPKLLYLELQSNMIVTLDEKAFSNILKQLLLLDAQDNRLRCDCRLSWITELKIPPNALATCSYPRDLQGKILQELRGQYLRC